MRSRTRPGLGWQSLTRSHLWRTREWGATWGAKSICREGQKVGQPHGEGHGEGQAMCAAASEECKVYRSLRAKLVKPVKPCSVLSAADSEARHGNHGVIRNAAAPPPPN